MTVSRFVGRARERSLVDEALREAAAGRGVLLLVGGEPGIGKTTFADVASRAAEEAGFVVAWGRAWEAGGAPPLWPWSQVGRALGFELPAFAAGSAEPEVARFALFDAIAGELGRVARDRPAFVVLDDLHAADAATLELLAFVARTMRGLRVVVLGTYRPLEASTSEATSASLARAAREGTFVPLRPLSHAEVTELVSGELGGDSPAARAIFSGTEGNPLFVREALRLAATRGLAEGALRLPDDVVGVLGARLATLHDEDRRVLEIAAVAGREVDRAVLSRVAAAGDLDAVLDRSARAGIVDPLAGDRVRFTHVLLRDALYRRIPAPRRAALHAAIAAAIELRRIGAGPDELAAIAHHRIEAGAAGELAALVEAVLATTDAARATVAFDDVASLVRRALDALPPEAKLHRARLLVALAEVQHAAGEPSSVATAADAFSLAREVGAPEVAARAALAWGAEFRPGMIDRGLVEALELAIVDLPRDEVALAARVWARLAAARQPGPDPDLLIEMALAALAAARPTGDVAALRSVLASAGATLAVFGAPATRASINREILELAVDAGDKMQALRAQARLVVDAYELGDRAAARAHVDGYEALLRATQAPRSAWMLPALRAMVALFEGRFEDAERLRDEARQAGDPASNPNLAIAVTAQTTVQLLTQERYEDLAVQVAKVSAESRRAALSGVIIPSFLATGDVRRGELGRARDTFDAVRRLPLFGDAALPLWAEVVAALGDRALAERAYARVLRFGDRAATADSAGLFVYEPPARLLGLLAASLGRLDDAERHLAFAAEKLETLGGHAFLPRVREELARVRRERVAAAPASAKGRAKADAVASAPPGDFALALEGDYFTVTSEAGTTRVRASRGLHLLTRLVELEGREAHVLELDRPGDGPIDVGDAGEVLDARATAAYRSRLGELRDALEEAESFADARRAGRIREEMESIAGELAGGLGLGGRARRSGQAAERARVNVQRHVRRAIDRLRTDHPGLAQHLDWAIRTGAFCSYVPDRTREKPGR